MIALFFRLTMPNLGARLKRYLMKRWGYLDPSTVWIVVEQAIGLGDEQVEMEWRTLLQTPLVHLTLYPQLDGGPAIGLRVRLIPWSPGPVDKPPLTGWTDDPEGRAGSPFTEPE